MARVHGSVQAGAQDWTKMLSLVDSAYACSLVITVPALMAHDLIVYGTLL